jgi:membrane protein YqaA with SNARE-associated domain
MLTEFAEWGYLGLFIASFLAATVIPFSSEIVFSALAFGGLNMWWCLAVATLGNFLGGMTCYYLGKLGKLEWIEKYLGVKKEKLDRFINRVHKHGDWFAFFSFLPGIGDAIALAAGFLRCRIWIVAVAMFSGKLLRYIVWLYINGLLLL